VLGYSSSNSVVVFTIGYTLCVVADDDAIQDFLWIDSCAKIADRVSSCYI